jgi:hypothetical protein
LRARLAEYRPHVDASGGVSFFATESPMPEDNSENRQHFRELDSVLQPLWLSRTEVQPSMHAAMGYFCRD